MATTTLISVEDYLKTSSDPDCEYIRGVIQERAVPELDHAAWQKALMRWFMEHEREWGIVVYAELRVQVNLDHFRIPDITILSRLAPREQIVTYAPLAVFEILSPEDAFAHALDKLAAYDQMGIPEIWVINPATATFYRYSSGQLTPTTLFELPGSSFAFPLAEIAALVD